MQQHLVVGYMESSAPCVHENELKAVRAAATRIRFKRTAYLNNCFYDVAWVFRLILGSPMKSRFIVIVQADNLCPELQIASLEA